MIMNKASIKREQLQSPPLQLHTMILLSVGVTATSPRRRHDRRCQTEEGPVPANDGWQPVRQLDWFAGQVVEGQLSPDCLCRPQLTYLGRDCRQLPPVLVDLYACAATRVDLSFCSLRTLRGLDAFRLLQELLLDNNCLDDSVVFPPSTSITTLSLNKNRVCAPVER